MHAQAPCHNLFTLQMLQVSPLSSPLKSPFLTPLSASFFFGINQQRTHFTVGRLELYLVIYCDKQSSWSGHTDLSGRNQSGIVHWKNSSPRTWLNTYFQPCVWHWAWPHTMHPLFHSNSHQSGTKQRRLTPHLLLRSIHRPLITTLSSSRKREAVERNLLQK